MFTRTLNRVQPKIPVTAMRTHAILAPVSTHYRKATCEEIGCLAFHNGWTLAVAGLPDDVVADAKNSRRRYRVERDDTTGAETLHFEAGQPCFKAAAHRIRIERPELFIVRAGDWRGNPDGTDSVTQLSGPDAWADSLQTNLERCTNG